MSNTRILIVDGSNVVMRCALGGELSSAQAVPTASNMIERATRECEATHLVIALDCPGEPTWRKALYPDYKANRTLDTSTWIIAAATEWHRQGWWVEDVVGYEADDIIATIGLRTRAARDAVQPALFKHGVMCHSISLIEPAVIKFLPCLNGDAGVITELAGALRGFARARLAGSNA